MLVRIAISTALSLSLLSLPASAEFVGFDANGDQQCGPEDMVYQAGPADVGSTRTIDVFFDDLLTVSGFGCTFCVTDRDRIGSWTWAYSLPGDWSTTVACGSDDPCFSVALSPYIPQRYPNFLCWHTSGYDFSFEHPISVYPHTIGTLQFQVADEGCIQWLVDVAPLCTGVQTMPSFDTFTFDGPGETCDTIPCSSVTETETPSWGALKGLFR